MQQAIASPTTCAVVSTFVTVGAAYAALLPSFAIFTSFHCLRAGLRT
jgi:hypothetical protein